MNKIIFVASTMGVYANVYRIFSLNKRFVSRIHICDLFRNTEWRNRPYKIVEEQISKERKEFLIEYRDEQGYILMKDKVYLHIKKDGEMNRFKYDRNDIEHTFIHANLINYICKTFPIRSPLIFLWLYISKKFDVPIFIRVEKDVLIFCPPLSS
jgi:hypothetical protein